MPVAPRRERDPSRLLTACGIALAVLLVVATLVLTKDLRTRAIKAGTEELARTALMLADQSERIFQSLDLVEIGLIEQIRARPGTATPEGMARLRDSVELHKALREQAGRLPQVETIALFDHKARPLNSSRLFPVPDVSFADRHYFQELLRPDGPDSLISDPVLSRSTGNWTIYEARRLKGPEGQFLGFIMGAIRLSSFEAFYRNVTSHADEAITLIRRDGMLLARHPLVAEPHPRDFGSALAGLILPAPGQAAVFRLRSALDGRDRVFAARVLEHFPIILAASTTETAMLEGWRRQAAALGVGALLLELGMAGLVLLGRRQMRAHVLLARAEAAEAKAAHEAVEAQLALAREREAAERALRLQDLRFRTALENMVQGLCMVDDAWTVQVMNPRLLAMLRLPPDEPVLGQPLRWIARRSLLRGGLRGRDIGSLASWLRARRRGGLPPEEQSSFTWVLADGRALSVLLRSMADGGWMASLEDVTERRQTEARIIHMARHDPLTGLPNRALFGERLREAVAAGRGCTLFCLDLDGFKEVNDTLGHPAGDALLRIVAERLRHLLRDTDTVARLGGDEFAVLLTDARHGEAAIPLAETIIAALGHPYDIGGRQATIGASLGIATLVPGDTGDEDMLLRRADLALYHAKGAGRRCHRLFVPAMETAIQLRRQLEADLRHALRGGEFLLYYQPVFRIHSGELTGFEALLRWHHPIRGLVMPGDFIPFAEESGLIVPIGAWALREACREAAGWPGGLKVAVNLSAAQFGQGRDLVTQVRAALAQSGLPSTRLELEVTESALLADTAETLAILQELRALGIGIALDDFGTGYSSLSYLRNFPFTKVKIDQSFVRDMGQHPDSAAIVHAVVGLGRSLGMLTQAEGIETEEQRRLLLSEACDEGQGYLFSPPRPAAEILGMLDGLARKQGSEEAA